MDQAERAQHRRTAGPWHLWVVGLGFLALYLVGGRDYILARTVNQGYFDEQGYGPDQIAYFSDYPAIPAVFWTINIAAGLAAAVLLLFRSRWAAPATLIAAASQLCLLVITFGFMDRWAILGPRFSLVDIGVWVLTVGLWQYCRAIHRRGILR
ncbi:hypothetical protein EDD27_4483 [Nonomuraea polychroma]|uniref:DoxX-like protein n=1 Tax=Nonomuraea polychroma TaxID=46176 RepID=A0A438M846_9ACTN|nr:hypothetical protein [Nonomuraea polychroma]RVX41890.1 hypothetical protein EDD27_4483 [Nonomuraea polychroma]